MGGTSVGSLIVSMLSVPENGKPKYSAEDLITIFPISAQETLQPRFKQKNFIWLRSFYSIDKQSKFYQATTIILWRYPF